MEKWLKEEESLIKGTLTRRSCVDLLEEVKKWSGDKDSCTEILEKDERWSNLHVERKSSKLHELRTVSSLD